MGGPNFRQKVLLAVLDLVSDQLIEVDGEQYFVRTCLSKDYGAEKYPWMAHGNPNPPDQFGSDAEFDVVSPEADDPAKPPSDYRYRSC